MLLRVFTVAALAISAAWGQSTGGTNTTATTSPCPQGAFLYQGRCTTTCPAGMIVYPSPPTMNSTCITVPSASPLPSKSPAPSSYPSRSPFPSQSPTPSLSVTPAPKGPCDTQLPGGILGSTGSCECGTTDWIVRIQGSMVPPFQKCVPVPPSMSAPYPPVACGSFVNGTVFAPEVADCVCRMPGPFVVLNPNDQLLPYACSAVPDITDSQISCNTTAYFSVLQGICRSLPLPPPPPPAPSMNVTLPSQPPCPADWFTFKGMCMPFCPAILYQGRCIESCPTGLYLLQTQCVDSCPPETYVVQMNGTQACVPKGAGGPTSCEEAVPGSHLDPVTGDCICNKTDWMVRNRTASVMEDRKRLSTFCAPAPMENPPFANCPSFIAGTWFDPAVQMCQCRRDVPLIVANPADPALPYACVANLTDPTLPVYRCNETAFFDFRVDGCVSRPLLPPQPSQSQMPPLPSQSQMPPLPSQMPPSASQMLPQPSLSPANPSRLPPPPPSELPPPSQAPIRVPSIAQSVVPLPSRSIPPSYAKTPMPSLPAIRRSAVPTPPPARSIAPTQRPVAVQSTLNLPGARIPDNATTAATTNTVQNIQAAIACSLRLPPEKVVIRNITVTRADGTTWSPQITTLLSANGTVLCYSLGSPSPAAGQRLLQAASGSSSIAVDYTVVEPPDEVVTLSATELTSTLAASSMMQEVMASTGAATLSATTDSSLASAGAAAPSPAGSGSASGSSNTGIVLVAGGVGAAMAVLVLAIGTILAVLYFRRSAPKVTTKPVPDISKSHTVMVIMAAAPETVTQDNPMVTTERRGFEPVLRGARV